MSRRCLRFQLIWLLLATAAQYCHAITVKIHTEDARATLLAMQNPNLSHGEALTIAEMHGNQAVLRKLHEFKITSTTEDFANALYAMAHGQPVTKPNEKNILLEIEKPKIPQLLALLQQIETNPKGFQQTIERRIAVFTPPNADIHLEGYVVAAGDGGGYAFGSTDFFLNIGIVDDLAVAQETTTHELYHAVQGAFASDRELNLSNSQSLKKEACVETGHLFNNLYEEGSAMYVGDLSLLQQSHSPVAARMLADIDDGLKHIDDSATLLEMSVIALNADQPVSYDDMYSVDFLGHGVVYMIGDVMAKAIAEEDGPQGLAALLKQPTYNFVLRYTQLHNYGADKDYPRLGPNTIAAAKRLAGGCH
ncbi:hypothetical protein GOB94_04030 [Granulicella sp. 5B5]|uniref:DUF5700 domain-containing putative Zn-dependent protease n=1 Tax=Granulicella sp. 5B5 TaxID=1617967 RepID=UPI0015F73D96|nr:DUF5700 domain-containing putative Zn-dependent protease [Granulicella sp. 5B5]QMV17952.1 hypothetical protein GOB94_04030 [Granulicella sp. 5B5]